MSEQKPFKEFDASDFVNLAVSPRSSTFGKLALVAELRENDTDPLADGLYGKAQIDAALQHRHHEIFSAWLRLSRIDQMDEVAEYLEDQAGNQEATIAQVAQQWVHESLYEKLRPTEASEPERELFSAGLRVILDNLRLRSSSFEGNRGV